MDIMGPPLEEQVDPAPWLVARRNRNVPALVERILQRNPEATEKEVVDTLAGWNVQANGALVAQQVLEFRRAPARGGRAVPCVQEGEPPGAPGAVPIGAA